MLAIHRVAARCPSEEIASRPFLHAWRQKIDNIEKEKKG
jgi:hypothetical protein